MYQLVTLETQGFRNLCDEQRISFSPRLNIIRGDNAQGKTNLLEAIYVLIERHSFRRHVHAKDFLRQGEGGLFIKGEFSLPQHLHFPLEKTFEIRQGRVVRTGSQKMEKMGGSFSALCLGPFDYHLFFYEKDWRRAFFNRIFSLLDPDYKKLLGLYDALLAQKKALLLQERPKELSLFNRKIAEIWPELCLRRKSLLSLLNDHFLEFFYQLFHESSFAFGGGGCSFRSRASLDEQLLGHGPLNAPIGLSTEDISSFLDRMGGVELRAKRVLYGPHREDFVLFLGEREVVSVGSMGQQKGAYFSFILSVLRRFQELKNERPVVLFDDVSGELDRGRLERFFGYLLAEQYQVFLTTVNPLVDHLLRGILSLGSSSHYLVDRGRVLEQ